MTDTLRADCEKLAYELYAVSALHTYTDRLVAFARAQQAKGLREAAGLADGWIEGKLIARDILLAATAREKEEA
jgi:hypothetical protein